MSYLLLFYRHTLPYLVYCLHQAVVARVIPSLSVGPRLFTWQQWNRLIQQSFERHFWIPLDESESNHIEHAHLIHRRGIYRDSVGASQQYADFQLRPNFPIAMVVVRVP